MAIATLKLEDVPAVKENDVELRFTALDINELGRVDTLEAAWEFLPVSGSGVLTLADRVTRFDASARTGLLVEADVCDGRTTTIVRGDGAGWRGWRWTEKEGDTHVAVTRTYLSSESPKAACLRYTQYWEKKSRAFDGADGIAVWTPIGSRFCGFEEDRA